MYMDNKLRKKIEFQKGYMDKFVNSIEYIYIYIYI